MARKPQPKERDDASTEKRFNWGPGDLVMIDPETGEEMSVEDYKRKYPPREGAGADTDFEF